MPKFALLHRNHPAFLFRILTYSNYMQQLRYGALLLLALLSVGMVAAQSTATLTGYITDVTSEPVVGAKVTVIDVDPKSATTDINGRFTITGLTGGVKQLQVALAQFYTLDMEIELAEGETKSLGYIQLRRESKDDLDTEELIPVFAADIENAEDLQNDNISGILSASRDVFVQTAAFTFGAARYRMRGYDSENTQMILNGVPMNELENGRLFWAQWGGLNDVFRNRTVTTGLNSSNFGFGGFGGLTTVDTRASTQRKQTRISYASGNRSYRNRLMATYNTGEMENGWAFSASASRRWADEGYIEGTFYDAYAYFFAVDRIINNSHTLNFTAFGSPQVRGGSFGSFQELYDLAGTNFYNPNWGFQAGEKRNARVADRHQPVFMLRHDWKVSNSSTLTTAVSYQTGRNGTTAIDWYNTRDPRPDFYRRLPSFIATQDPAQAAAVAEAFRNDPSLLQIDWDRLYDVNRNNFEEFSNDTESISGNRSLYILEERRFDSDEFNFYTNYNNVINEDVTISGGLSYQYYNGENFKVVNDLLGGDFYVDLNQFAERDNPNNPSAAFNDVENPNRILREGDRFGYDFDSHIHQASLWGQAEFTSPTFDYFIAGEVSHTAFWREGNVRNGLFPDNSFGKSETQNFTNFAVKGGATYKINGRNYAYANASYRTRAPFFRNSYLSVRDRDQLTPNLRSETIMGGEIGFVHASPKLKARATAFLTRFENQNQNINFFSGETFDEETAEGADSSFVVGFVNYTLKGIDKQHVGLEAAFEYQLTSIFSVEAAAAVGQYYFDSRPSVTITNANSAQALVEDRTVFVKNFRVGGQPQQAYTVGANFNFPFFAGLYVNVNYFDDLFIDFNPNRRTEKAITTGDPDELIAPGSEQWNAILNQEQVEGNFTVDVFARKSWKINDYFIYLNVGVSNLLNNTDFITGGFEQRRFDFESRDPNRFPPRYFYSFGANYFASLAIRL